jgi:hypothetical protein
MHILESAGQCREQITDIFGSIFDAIQQLPFMLPFPTCSTWHIIEYQQVAIGIQGQTRLQDGVGR